MIFFQVFKLIQNTQLPKFFQKKTNFHAFHQKLTIKKKTSKQSLNTENLKLKQVILLLLGVYVI